MADADVYRTILAAGSLAADGATGPLSVNDVDPDGIDLIINLTGFTGGTTPSVTFSAAWAADANQGTYPPTTWGAVTSTAALTAGGRVVLTLPKVLDVSRNTTAHYVQLSWAILGAPTAVNHSGIYCE